MMSFILRLLLLLQPHLTSNVYDVETTPLQIYQDYKANKDKADTRYLNKKILIKGKVDQVSANLWTIYFAIPDPNGLTACIDDTDHELLNVPIYKHGDIATLVCIGSGLVFNLPILLHCRLPEDMK